MSVAHTPTTRVCGHHRPRVRTSKPPDHLCGDDVSLLRCHGLADTKNHQHCVHLYHSHRVDVGKDVARRDAPLRVRVLDKGVKEVRGGHKELV